MGSAMHLSVHQFHILRVNTMKIKSGAVKVLLDQSLHISCVWSLAVEYFWGIQGQAHHLCRNNMIVTTKWCVNSILRCHIMTSFNSSRLLTVRANQSENLDSFSDQQRRTWKVLEMLPHQSGNTFSTSQRCAYSRFVSPAPNFASGSVSRGRKRFHRPAALASCCSCWCLAGMVHVSCS